MRQDHVLLVGDADFIVAVAFGQVGARRPSAADASPGMPPIGFRETVTMA
jgi:hypothetical protein